MARSETQKMTIAILQRPRRGARASALLASDIGRLGDGRRRCLRWLPGRAGAQQQVYVKRPEQKDEGIDGAEHNKQIVAARVVKKGVMASAVRKTPYTTQG